ncbi:hypothetical protein EFR84_04840 [Rhizobium chutanense]|uniref:Uncharacterized protein n=1 Tax=Rhizobium chutanense TaxID=2035448 RepID=A0A432P7Y4_9HYPH|nr:hypothetical protein EFR84_04840 [Rhizobium chutanense]
MRVFPIFVVILIYIFSRLMGGEDVLIFVEKRIEPPSRRADFRKNFLREALGRAQQIGAKPAGACQKPWVEGRLTRAART